MKTREQVEHRLKTLYDNLHMAKSEGLRGAENYLGAAIKELEFVLE